MGYIIYNSTTGIIRMTTNVNDENIAKELTQTGESYLQGAADITTQKIDVTKNPNVIINNIIVMPTMDFLRQERNGKLADTDWVVLPDSPLSDTKKAEWITYRQALRDLPTNYTNSNTIDDITFPTEPDG